MDRMHDHFTRPADGSPRADDLQVEPSERHGDKEWWMLYPLVPSRV